MDSVRHWIRSRHVWREQPGRFEPAALAVEGGTIVAVGRPDDVPAGAVLRDVGDLWLMPGLLNTHVHLDFSASKTPLRDFEAEDPCERLLRAARNAHALLRSGVTTARDCGSQWQTLALARRPDLSPVPLPRLILSGPPITVPYGHLHFLGGVVRNDRDVLAHVARIRKDGGRSVKAVISGGQMTPGSKPEDTAFSQEELGLIAGEARRLGLPSAAHVLSTDSVRRGAIARFDSLEHCAYFERRDDGRLYRRYDEDVARTIRDNGSAIMANLSTAMPRFDAIYAKAESDRTPLERHQVVQFETMIENFGRMLKLGIPMVCGNDAGVDDTPFDSTWMEVEWMIRAGQSPADALRSATIGSARALLLADTVGLIEPGYSADIIALGGDPLRSASALASPLFVMRQGETVVDRSGESRRER